MIYPRRCQIGTEHKHILCAIPYVLLAGAVFAVYSNVYANAFLYDDNIFIVHNQFLQSWDDLRSIFLTSATAGSNIESTYYRPIQILLYKVVFQMVGLSQFAFHFLNVGLHAANACLVYMLGKKLGFKPVASFLAALLWGLHPVHTEAVTYMSATVEPLYSFFCILGVIVLLPDFTRRRMLAAALLMILGLLSKEMAIIFPLLAMSCYYFLNDKRFDLKIYFRFLPLVLMSVAYVAFRSILLPNAAGVEGAETAPFVFNYGPIAILPRYLGFVLIPTHLHMGYDIPVYGSIWHAAVLCSIGLFLLATVQILRERAERSLPLSWGLCWFAGALMPTLSSDTLFYEHWMYLPSVGLFLGVAQSLALSMERLKPARLRLSETGVVTMALLAAIVLSFLTYKQNFVWREPIAFYNNIIAQGEKAVNAHNNLGVIYTERGEYEKAIEQYRAAIKNSNDTLDEAQINLAMTQLMLPDGKSYTEEALMHLHRILDINPHSYQALNALSQLYSKKGDAANASLYRYKADDVRKKFLNP